MRLFSSVCTAAVIFAGAASATTTTVFDDDFAAEVEGAVSTVSTLNFDALENWNIADGAVDLFTNGGFGLPCGSAGCLDLDGSIRDAARLESITEFSFIAGASYTLSLDFAGRNQGGEETLSFGVIGVASETLTFLSQDITDVTETLTFGVAADTVGSLFIDHEGGDNFGILLDRVTLTETTTTPAVVPLPAAGWLLLAGLGGMGVARKRRS